jgi:hypothetical protein
MIELTIAEAVKASGFTGGMAAELTNLLAEAYSQGRMHEREECAKLCDALWKEEGWDANAGYAADLIRERGQA